MRLLLISNSTGPEGGYLDWCESAIVDYAGDARRVLFIPFAGTDERSYGATAVARLESMGFEARSFDHSHSSPSIIDWANVVFIGGGNTFLLLDRLISTGLLEAIRDAVVDGLPYIGTSAGSNVAGPTIRTTNDMPIVEPPTFQSLGLVSFQINPHYIDPDPDSTHQGETREQRLMEFLDVADTPVVALREGSLLRVEDSVVTVGGEAGGRVYRKAIDPLEVTTGTRIDDLLRSPNGTAPDTGVSS